VLCAGQEALARRFATPCVDRFAGLPRSIGPNGVPLLENGVARFVCAPHAQHEAGDHVIFVMRVGCWEHAGGAALAFHAGSFCGIGWNAKLQFAPPSDKYFAPACQSVSLAD
jgi:flavin reductase (DIM6/NTAB) family NADH-FMN oxidoreductase RutF